MTAATKKPRFVSIDATLGQTVLAWDFPLTAETAMTVLRERAGVTAQLALGDDYSFPSGLGNDNGGTLTLAAGAEAGDVYLLVGSLPEIRGSEFLGSQAFKSDKFNADLDTLTLIAQEHRRDIGRAWKSGYGEEGKAVATLAEGHFWKANADGNMVDGGSAADIEGAQEAAATATAASLTAVAARNETLAAVPMLHTASIAALRLVTVLTLAAQIYVDGYYGSADPRGGGTFKLDAADTTTADDSGWVIVDAVGRRWKRQTSILSPDDFGVSPALTGAENKAALDKCMAKVTPADGYYLELVGGAYEFDGGVAGPDGYRDILTLPFSGDFGRSRQVVIKSRAPAIIKVATSSTVVIRGADTNIHLDNIHLRKVAGTHDNIAIVVGPEDLTDTTTQVSCSDFSGANFSIDGFWCGMWFQPGPTTDGGAKTSGCYNHRFSNFQITNCVQSTVTRAAVNDANNYPTRAGFKNGRIERTMVAADWRYAETFQFDNVETQFVNYKAEDFPDETNFPVADSKARIFWTCPSTRQCSVDRGRNESAVTDYYVWAEYGTPKSSLFLNTLYNALSFLGTDALDPNVGVASAVPQAIIMDGRRIELEDLNGSTGATPIRNQIGALEVDGNPAVLKHVGSERARTASVGLFVGATATPDGATRGGVQLSSPDVTESRTATTTTGTKNHFGFYNPNGKIGSIYTNGTTTTFGTTSDARLKTNKRGFDSGAIIDALDVWQFDWISGGSDYGVMAQDAYEVLPRAVYVGGDDPQTDPWQLDSTKFVWVLLAEVKALRARVAALEAVT